MQQVFYYLDECRKDQHVLSPGGSQRLRKIAQVKEKLLSLGDHEFDAAVAMILNLKNKSEEKAESLREKNQKRQLLTANLYDTVASSVKESSSSQQIPKI